MLPYLSSTSTRLDMRPSEMVSWTLEFLRTKFPELLVKTRDENEHQKYIESIIIEYTDRLQACNQQKDQLRTRW